MKRCGFTIILNGKKHLLHNNYYEYLLEEVFDYLVIVEGATLSKGSTSWCTGSIENFHKNGHSIDGTLEYLIGLQKKYPKKLLVLYNQNDVLWNSKDEMVNVAIQGLKSNNLKCL